MKDQGSPLAEGLRQWVELCLLQIEEKKRVASGLPTNDDTDEVKEVELQEGGMEAVETNSQTLPVEVET